MPVVYITNFSAHDYSDAAQHGVLRPLTSGTVNLLNVDRLLTILIEELKDSTPEDFLLISGSPVIAMLAFATWLAQHGICQLLILDAKERVYVSKPIKAEQIASAIEALQGP